jgi:hypothetical protein
MARTIVTAALFLVSLLSFAHGTEAGGRRTQALIYYGNETSQQAAQSANYATLLSILRNSTSATAATLARNILSDATESSAVVRRDADALLAAARRLKFDLVVFTNDLALKGQFWSYRSATDALETRTLPPIPQAASNVLATSPLSRPEVLRMAVLETGSLYPADSVDAVLIVNSHGSDEMLLMPRVSADLSAAGSAEAFARQLQSDDEPSGPPPEWATLKGTDKLAFWHTVAQAGAAHGMRFPLIFLETCESGTATWSQWRAIPASVGRIAHTGGGSVYPAKLDYAALLGSERTDWINGLASGLKSSGMYVGAKWTLLAWVLLSLCQSVPWPVYFAPFGLWVIWSALLAAARSKSARRMWAPRAQVRSS